MFVVKCASLLHNYIQFTHMRFHVVFPIFRWLIRTLGDVIDIFLPISVF